MTLNQLEKKRHPKPSEDDSYLVRRCYELRDKNVKDLEVEDLRLLIGQEIGLKYLIPLAIDKLNKEPFAEGDYYPGDLLMNVLRINSNYWEHYPEQKKAIIDIFNNSIKELEALDVDEKIKADLYFAFDKLSSCSSVQDGEIAN